MSMVSMGMDRIYNLVKDDGFVRCRECTDCKLHILEDNPMYSCNLMSNRNLYYHLNDMVTDCPIR